MNDFEFGDDDFIVSNSIDYDNYYDEGNFTKVQTHPPILSEFAFDYTPPPIFDAPVPIIYEEITPQTSFFTAPPIIPPPTQPFEFETPPPIIPEDVGNSEKIRQTPPPILEGDIINGSLVFENTNPPDRTISKNAGSSSDKMQSADYGLLALQIASMVLSVAVIIGLLVPLLKQLKNGNFYQARSSRRSGREPIYSTYNLYLVYSAVADLSCLATIISEHIFGITVTIMVNLWINAVIVYEVLALLRATKNARRINQPSLMKVNLQAGSVIVGMILLTVIPMVVPTSYTVLISIWYGLYFIPILFVIGVTIFVKYKGYLPPSNGTTPRDKAVRGLALFFFRVILVYLVIWIPGFVLGMIDIFTDLEGPFRFWYDCLTALQPIVSFCLIVTKPDVKKYIIDLVTLAYLFGDSNGCSCKNTYSKTNKSSVPSIGDANQGNRRRTRTTVLGYTFSGADDTANAEDDDDNASGSANDGNNEDIETGSA